MRYVQRKTERDMPTDEYSLQVYAKCIACEINLPSSWEEGTSWSCSSEQDGGYGTR